MKCVYAVVTQFEPSHKYDADIESLWSTKELAIKEAKADEIHDWVSVREIHLNIGRDQASVYIPDIVVKSPRRPE